MKKIQTNLPFNIEKKWENIFIKRKFYNFPYLETKKYKNVFLTHYGIILKNLLPIRYTLPNAYGYNMPNAGFIWQFYKKGIEIFLVCKFGKSLKTKTLDKNKNYLFIYSPWFGYFSWVTESLPRIISVLDSHDNLTLILPESYSKKKFVMDSLKIFQNLKYEIIEEGVHMNVPKITIPELKPYTYIFDPKNMKDYRSLIWNYVDKINLNIETHEKIYVSRKKAKNRKIINNDAVEKVFLEFGYKVILFEDLSFFNQVFLMQNCKVLAGVHGAGFANISYMRKNSILFEMIKEYSSYKEERPSYWRLSSALDIKYYIQYCKPKKYGDYDLWVGVDLIVDINKLRNNLNLIENANKNIS